MRATSFSTSEEADDETRSPRERIAKSSETRLVSQSNPSEARDSLVDLPRIERRLYIQMEYCEQNLKEFMHQSARWKLLEMHREILKHLVNGLQYLHDDHAIFHRDIKPQNMLLNLNPFQAKLGDFGLATNISRNVYRDRQSPGQPDPTSTFRNPTGIQTPHNLQLPNDHSQGLSLSKGVGTEMYCSPEQRTGGAGYGPKSDIYSVGLVIFEVIFCKEWTTLAERAFDFNRIKHHSEMPELSEDAERPIPKETLDTIELIRKMVQKDPAKRPSAADVLKRLASEALPVGERDRPSLVSQRTSSNSISSSDYE